MNVENITMAVMMVCGAFACGLIVAVAFMPVPVVVPCPVCGDNFPEYEKMLEDNLDFCVGRLSEEKAIAVELWDDYWFCQLAVLSGGTLEGYEEVYEGGFGVTQADIDMAVMTCKYGENYSKYYEHYEGR